MLSLLISNSDVKGNVMFYYVMIAIAQFTTQVFVCYICFYSSTSTEARLIYLHPATLHVRQDLKRTTALGSGRTNSSPQHPTQIAMQMWIRPLAASYNTYINVIGIDLTFSSRDNDQHTKYKDMRL